MIIYCHDFESFMNCVDECTRRGLQFKAHTDNLRIDLTGGH